MTFIGQLAAAQALLRDPSIPDGEQITFRVASGDESYVSTSRVTRTLASGEEVYEFTTASPREQVTVELSLATLATRSVRTVAMPGGLPLETITSIVPRSGEQSTRIEAVNLNDLMFKLRGFPFASGQEIPVLFAAAARGSQASFAPHVSRVGSERLRVGSRTVETAKLELVLSVPTLWRTFSLAPRTFFWYSTEPPYVLVRAETTQVPGSPRWLLEATGYSGW
ncbi:MAG: hypothetical protein ACKO4Z_05130 [Planctomycetota bacterium]